MKYNNSSGLQDCFCEPNMPSGVRGVGGDGGGGEGGAMFGRTDI